MLVISPNTRTVCAVACGHARRCCRPCVHACHCCCRVCCCHCTCHLWLCLSPLLQWVLPPLPCMSTAAVHVVATTTRVICGHGCRRRHHVYCLQLWVSLPPCKLLLQAVHVVCGCACHLRPCVLSLLPWMSLQPCTLLLQAVHIAAATRAICGCVCCHCGLCMSLLGPQYSHVIEKKELVKKRKRKHKNTSVGLTATMQVAAAGCACCLQPCVLSLPPCVLSVAVHVAAAVHVAVVMCVAATGHAEHQETCMKLF